MNDRSFHPGFLLGAVALALAMIVAAPSRAQPVDRDEAWSSEQSPLRQEADGMANEAGRPDRTHPDRPGRLTPEERQQLRRDIREYGRDVYRDPARDAFHDPAGNPARAHSRDFSRDPSRDRPHRGSSSRNRSASDRLRR
ncbi:MAG: hypothetical protein LBE33_06055 [Zoogloeaceae bacterium]|nr:hypothetical protein [Zoogloeaceae bacterium]